MIFRRRDIPGISLIYGVVYAYERHVLVRSPCVLIVSSTIGIVFNPNASAIADDSQSANDIHRYFKSQPKWRTPATKIRCSFYRMG